MTIIIRKLGRPGCRPCAALSNYIEEVMPEITEAGGAVTDHNVMVELHLLEKYEIQSVPVLVYERNGVEVARLNGLVSPQEVLDALEHAKEAR